MMLSKLIELYTKLYSICLENRLENVFMDRVKKHVRSGLSVFESIARIAEETIEKMVYGEYGNVFERLAAVDANKYIPHGYAYGICANLLFRCNIYFDLAVFLTWPKSTLNKHYPVPCEFRSPSAAYEYYSNERGNVWDRGTQYGRDRRELLAYMVNICRDLVDRG